MVEPPRKKLRNTHHGTHTELEETVVFYGSSPNKRSPLTVAIEKVLPINSKSKNVLASSDLLYAQLGEYAVEQLWIGVREEGGLNGPTLDSVLDNWAPCSLVVDTQSPNCNISSKVARLLQIIQLCSIYDTSINCIVHVKLPIVASYLCKLLQDLPNKTHNCAILDDSLVKNTAFPNNNLRNSSVLIFTERAADLDIPQAPFVIRFDITPSMLSYLHCKSAALKHFVHLVESGNDAHRNILTKLSLPDPTLRSWTISFLTNIAGAIPPVALHEDNPADVYLSEGESRLVDPVAGGIISEASSLRVIYQYAASLPNHTVDRDRPFFEYQESISTNGETYFKCSIHFPSSSTVGVVAGEPHLSRARARRSACYQACTKLFKKGLLDYTLYPRHHFDKSEFGRTYTPDGGVASNSSTYLRRRPRFWMSSFAEGSLKQLYPTIICLEDIDSAPIVLLTRLPLPEFAPFNVFEGGNVISVGLRRIQLPIHVDEDQIELLRRYTVRACRAMTNKRFVSKLEETVYFFAPLDGRNLSAADDPRALRIAWDYVRLAADGWARPFDLARIEEETKDAVIQDKAVEFTRRFFVSELMRELNPLSKPIEGSREAGYASYAEFCRERSQRYDELTDFEQPLLRVEVVPSSLNYLTPATKVVPEQQKTTAQFLIPQLCMKFAIPASILRTLLFFPSIARRIDDVLLVKELNTTFFNHAISEPLLHAALTPPSTLLEYDYERLEFLGDTYLKLLSSAYCFLTVDATVSEAQLHRMRIELVGNKALLRDADWAGLAQYIQARPFAHKRWQPPNFSVLPDPPKGSEKAADRDDTMAPLVQNTESTVPKTEKLRTTYDEGTQLIGDKAIADVVEAIIGAAYITNGDDGARQAAKALHIPIPSIDRWTDLAERALTPPRSFQNTLWSGTIEAVEAIAGIKVERPHFLVQALSHGSWEGKDLRPSQRLEFLGDAVLDLLVVRHLFFSKNDMSPGTMTMLKSAATANATLAALCVASGLHQCLHASTPATASAVRAYVKRIEHARQQEYTLAKREGRPPGQYWINIDFPRVLADLVEAVMGALYASTGFTLDATETFFARVVRPFMDAHIRLATLAQHPTKVLCELLQSHGCQNFQIVRHAGEDRSGQVVCDVVLHEEIVAAAQEANAANAAKRASELALATLSNDSTYVRRVCDCRATVQARKAQKKALKSMLRGFEGELEVEKLIES